VDQGREERRGKKGGRQTVSLRDREEGVEGGVGEKAGKGWSKGEAGRGWEGVVF